MSGLLQIIVCTPDLGRLRQFYEEIIGLKVSEANPFWIAFETAGSMLALTRPAAGRERGIQLTIGSADLDADVAALRARGVEFEGPVHEAPFGRFVAFHDLEGNVHWLHQRSAPPGAGDGPWLRNAIVNCDDLGRAVGFYRDRLGLEVASAAPGWVEFDTGGTRIALHHRSDRPELPLHAAQRVAFAFETPDLTAWSDELHRRGLRFATAPSTADFGVYAEAVDPDDNVVVFREPPLPHTLEEDLAADFEDEEVPHVASFHKPLKKTAKAVSRVALRPEYRGGRERAERAAAGLASAVARPKKAAKKKTTKRGARAAARKPSVRGGGAERTRLSPKRTADPKRAKNRPATGRLKKAERRTASRKRTAVANMSRSKPVKHAAARRGPGRGGRRR
jgi:predicted enzyme related to lactoylglutathione lyase